MKKSAFVANCHLCKVTIDEKKQIVIFAGTQEDIDTTKVEMYEKLGSISEKSCIIAKPFCSLLRSAKGEMYLESIFGAEDSVMGYVNNDGLLVCAGFGEDSTQKFLGICKNLLLTNRIVYKNSYRHFLKSSKWENVRKVIENDYLVQVHIEDDKMIVIDGLNGDVSVATRELKTILEKNEHHVKTLNFEGAKSRCMQRYFQPQINSIRQSMREGDGYIEDESNDACFKLVLSGPPNVVQQVEGKLRELEKKVWHCKLIFKRDIVTGRELNTLVNGLKNTNQKRLKSTFEEENKCCLEFLNLKPEQRNSFRSMRTFSPTKDTPREYLPRRAGRGTRWKSATARVTTMRSFSKPKIQSVTFNQATIKVKQGDITKEKADILVNVLSPTVNLKHTAVGQAFSKTGGVEWAKGLEIEKGKLGLVGDINLPPGSVIKTASGGHLGCKQVQHMILDKWKGPATTKDLVTAIGQVLLSAARDKMTSVAFPALGCGKLFKFPADQMAVIALNVLQQEIPKYPTIQTITFVIYDDDVYVEFLRKLKKYSPDGNGAVGGTVDDSDSDDVDINDSDSNDSDDSDEFFNYIKATNDAGELEVQGSADAGIQIYAANKDICDRAKQNLKKFLKDNYLYEDCVKNETITRLNRRIHEEMKKIADRLNVDIKIPNIEHLKHDPKTHRSGGEKKMLLCRILLGNAYLCSQKNPSKYKKPPCKDLHHLEPNCTKHHGFFDSVLGDGQWIFREFAVYDGKMVYPEYIITYKRI
ncbi:uncharacterized protein LOC126829264 isoform X2 [Patella vulgata]|uniref:uncharacterized protein LOC126829264 isoform X2 n=1 Tax=Patella vulgata TaxID=6465 RepID=UPI0024A87675|nr:uncharacterized protein LOC126829264 isoform X2 [Patella vulgata]